jgi:hypothetical protein
MMAKREEFGSLKLEYSREITIRVSRHITLRFADYKAHAKKLTAHMIFIAEFKKNLQNFHS